MYILLAKIARQDKRRGQGNSHREHREHGAVHGHGHRHLVQGDAIKQGLLNNGRERERRASVMDEKTTTRC